MAVMEGQQPKRQGVSEDERLYASAVAFLLVLIVTAIAVGMFMHGTDSPGWGWAIFGGGAVLGYRKWVL